MVVPAKESKMLLSKQWFIDSHNGNIKEVYHFIERLGSGGFGVVYLAEHRKNGTLFKKKLYIFSRGQVCC
jgi:serine/threonine protein kinase